MERFDAGVKFLTRTSPTWKPLMLYILYRVAQCHVVRSGSVRSGCRVRVVKWSRKRSRLYWSVNLPWFLTHTCTCMLTGTHTTTHTHARTHARTRASTYFHTHVCAQVLRCSGTHKHGYAPADTHTLTHTQTHTHTHTRTHTHTHAHASNAPADTHTLTHTQTHTHTHTQTHWRTHTHIHTHSHTQSACKNDR